MACIQVVKIHRLTYFQPTLGVILLTDTRPSEPKSLLELKVKKTAPVPAADQAPVATINDNLVDEGDDEASLPGEFDYESDTNPMDDD